MRALKEADVVLAVGCRFSSWLREDGHPITPGAPDQWIIHVDQDPTTPGRAQGVALSLIGDAQAVLEQILEHIPPQSAKAEEPGPWLKELVGLQLARRRQLELASDNTTPLHPARLARDFGALLPDDALVVYDGGHTTFWTIDMTRPGIRVRDSTTREWRSWGSALHSPMASRPHILIAWSSTSWETVHSDSRCRNWTPHAGRN